MQGWVGALGRVTGAIGVIHWSCPARALACPGKTPWAKALSEMSSQQLWVLVESPHKGGSYGGVLKENRAEGSPGWGRTLALSLCWGTLPAQAG